VLFDYSDVGKDGNTTTFSFSEQVKKLKAVMGFVKEKIDPKETNVVAHSQGCIIVGLASPDNVDKVILVSGPTSAPGENIKNYFLQRPGTEINEEGVSKIERSDGTTTFIRPEYWKEAYDVSPAELFLNLAKNSKIYFVRARQDQVVTGEDYSMIKKSNITFVELDGNHDFEGKDRKPWLSKMVELLKE
jgi:pimeloyl-ACP methyl ester carboxylesterase